MDDEPTFWNGEHALATKCKVIVGKAPLSSWWCADMEGQTIDAVRVEYRNEVFYIDDRDGIGWDKVTIGRGSPQHFFRSLPDNSEEVPDV